ncbi:MAG TPA: ATP-binding protein [Candidatus Binatia bacterium]|nr:ATP-binding protein [Candidatus Binatia bacterium]
MRSNEEAWLQPEFKEAFVANERRERIRSGKVACALVVFLMPAGIALDLYVYPERWGDFLPLRLLCSVLAVGLWILHMTPLGVRYYRWLGIPIALLPAFFISWMIYLTEGPESPYYAGLILILLAVNAIVHWSTGESLLAIGLLFVSYLIACIPWNIIRDSGIFFNNVYFLVLTGIIVVTGNYLYNQLHFREFVLRFELGQNRQKLEETNQKLVELDRIKSRFFANISHELRTPLTLLLAPLQTLIQERAFTLEAEMRQLLLIMQSNGMRLLKLINDLLDLVRLESGKMEVKSEPVAIEPFLQGLVNGVKKSAEDRGISLEVICDPTLGTVVTDGDKLERILLNLLFNALKFTPAGGKVHVDAKRQDDELLLKVSDTGTGISGEQLPFIFDRFWQADTSSQRKYRGVGIGLALVKELVEIQGGNVAVASEIGKGTEFTVRLPYREAEVQSSDGLAHMEALVEAASPVGTARANGSADTWLKNLDRQAEFYPSMTSLREALRPVETSTRREQPRVLIADDEPDMLKYLKSQLSLNFQVIEAVDGQQAIEKATQFLPDVIVCDMMMPEKNGLEVCRAIRERTSTRTIPILLLTARADEDTKLAALSAGANDFITKPFSMTELSVRLKNLFDTYNLQRELARQNQVLEATIEQLKETEVQLVHSEKLASLGRMSAGIIHEINNPLNFAKTALYVLRIMTESLGGTDKKEFREVLEDMAEGINRISGIVSDLRTFTQPHLTQLERVLVMDVVNSALRLLSNEWESKVIIEKEIPEDQIIWANRNQMTQVMVNLLQNALQALAKKPSCKNVATIWVQGREEDGESVIVVRDNGEGIAAENLQKIFDPFFTTKDVGEGMGLGLSICYRIIKQHGGRIQVCSEQGKYSEFRLYFPHRPASTLPA